MVFIAEFYCTFFHGEIRKISFFFLFVVVVVEKKQQPKNNLSGAMVIANMADQSTNMSKRSNQTINCYLCIKPHCVGTQWLVDLEFNGPVNTIKVMSSRSVNLTTLFLGRLRPLSN